MAVDIHARKAVDLDERVLRQLDHLRNCRAIRSLLCCDQSRRLEMMSASILAGQLKLPAQLTMNGADGAIDVADQAVAEYDVRDFPVRPRGRSATAEHSEISPSPPPMSTRNMAWFGPRRKANWSVLLSIVWPGGRVIISSPPSCLTVRVSAAANNLLLRLAWPRCPQAGRIARPIQINRTAPMKPEIR